MWSAPELQDCWGVFGGKWVCLSQLFHETPALFKLIMAHKYAFLQKTVLTLWYYKRSGNHQKLQGSFCGFWWIRVFSCNFLSPLWYMKKQIGIQYDFLWNYSITFYGKYLKLMNWYVNMKCTVLLPKKNNLSESLGCSICGGVPHFFLAVGFRLSLKSWSFSDIRAKQYLDKPHCWYVLWDT